jgi:hypothetical protein
MLRPNSCAKGYSRGRSACRRCLAALGILAALCGGCTKRIDVLDQVDKSRLWLGRTFVDVADATDKGTVFDSLSFALVETKTRQECSVRAVVESYAERADGQRHPLEPSRAVKADAWAIITGCHIRNVTGVHPLDLERL